MKETDKLLKTLADGLKLMAKGIESVAEQVNSLTKAEAKAKPKPAPSKTQKAPAAKKAAAKPAKKTVTKPAPKTTAKGKKSLPATDMVMAVIEKAGDPVDNSQIASQTGFSTKKVSNTLFKLKKQGRIKSVKRGKYVAA